MKKKIVTLNDLHAYLASTRGEAFANGTMQGFEMMCPDRELVWGEQVFEPDDQEPMPRSYYLVKEIIEKLDLTFVRKVYLTTPASAKRWEKINGIDEGVLERLLQSMDAYIRAKKKRYKDITLTINNWYRNELKHRPAQANTREIESAWKEPDSI